MKRAISIIVITLAVSIGAFAQSSAFNYQGRLNDNGQPANGTYLLQFKLYNALGGGAQVGSTLSDVSVTVANGVFTANLDFGAASFDGADRFLDISVKKNVGDAYTVLTPRQKIASTPYAVRAAVAGSTLNFTGNLAGDVSGTQGATAVNSVGGQSSANVASGVQAANNATSANTPNAIAKRDGAGKIAVAGITFPDNTTLTTANGSGTNLLASQNAWTGQNTFVNGLSANGVAITNVGNPISATDAANKTYVDANTVKFVPGAEQLSVGDANGTAPMINLRGGSTCCSGPGGHTPAWFWRLADAGQGIPHLVGQLQRCVSIWLRRQ
jgi:hypothetical protein